MCARAIFHLQRDMFNNNKKKKQINTERRFNSSLVQGSIPGSVHLHTCQRSISDKFDPFWMSHLGGLVLSRA